VRAVAQGRGEFPDEVRQYSGKRGMRIIRPFRCASNVIEQCGIAAATEQLECDREDPLAAYW